MSDILRFPGSPEPEMAETAAVPAVNQAEADRMLTAISELLEGCQDEVVRAILEDTCFELAELLGEEAEREDAEPETEAA
jgi:hypothetical protein